jgi:hypothetical protein
MKLLALLFTTALASPFCYGQHRCVENGKTLITDRPCASASETPEPKSNNTIGDAKHSAYSTNFGAWRGQVQFMAKAGTAVVSDAHAVGPLVIEIDPRGKVSGSSTETGCTFKGIATPGIADTLTILDVTLSNCRYAAYNRQMTGRLALYKAQGYTDFSLVAYDLNKRPSGHYEIKGTLRR